jgi:hypothetical protein
MSLLFQFPSLIQAGIESGKLVQVISSTGVPLSMVRDAATGQFAGNAIALASNGLSLNPVTAPIQLITGGIQAYQTHQVAKGLNALQSSVGVLQTTTSIIGVLGATTAVLGAVNLYQTLKLKKAVENLELKVENGFIDLEQSLVAQRKELIEMIKSAAQDIKFESQRIILAG